MVGFFWAWYEFLEPSADSQEMLWDSAVFHSLMGGKGDSLLALPDTGSCCCSLNNFLAQKKKKKAKETKTAECPVSW